MMEILKHFFLLSKLNDILNNQIILMTLYIITNAKLKYVLEY